MEQSHVSHRKKSGRGPLGRHRQRRGPDRQGEGPEGRAAGRAARRRRGQGRRAAASRSTRATRPSARARMWGTSRTLVANLVDRRHQGLRAASSRSPASAIAPRCRARTCSSRSATATTSSIRSRKASRSRRRSRPRSSSPASTAQKVGQVAAEIRAFRPPEPYKGKGVKYAGRVHLPQGRQEEVTEPHDGQAQLIGSRGARRRVRRRDRGAPPAAARGCPCSARRSTSTRR